MKRIILITSAAILAFAAVAAAQTSSTKPLADVAKAEEARRQQTKKPARVFTNSSLKPDISTGVAPAPAPAAPTPATNTSPGGSTTPDKPAADAPAVRDQAYWAGRIKTARDQVQRTQIFMDSLQSRINALTTDFVNRDDPAQRAKIEGDRKAALAELERVKQEMTDQQKAIAAIEDEARRAGVPAGWLRPGA